MFKKNNLWKNKIKQQKTLTVKMTIKGQQNCVYYIYITFKKMLLQSKKTKIYEILISLFS